MLTGMAIGLNSTISISEGNKKLPPCPILFLSTSGGLLQVYYFIHKTLPPMCTIPEVLKQIQPVPFNPTQAFIPTSSSANGFTFTNSGPPTTITTQPKEPSQPLNSSSIDDLSNAIGMNSFKTSTPVQQVQTKHIVSTNNPQSSPTISNNKKLLQMIDEFQSKLKSLEKPLSKSSEPSINLDKSLETLTTTLTNQLKSSQTSSQSIKSMTSEHIESMTKIENARHQIKLSQKENLYHLLKDRELDPWTQSRLDSIKIKYDKLKHDLNVLLQLTHTTIHDKSFSTNDDESENEDFLPDLEISLNTNETMRQRIQKRICELSHKVSETEKDLQLICSKLSTDLLSSKTFDSTYTKTTMSSNRPFHSLDAQILSHLEATHKNVHQIHVPPAPVIHLTSTVEQKKQPILEITKPVTPSVQPSTPKQPNSPLIESESFQNMLRIVKTSIDLFSGVTSPEQLQELSNTIAASPLSSTQKSNIASINKTPTMPKTTNLSKTSIINKPLNTTISSTNAIQTPAKSMTSPLPTISVTPATPAAQNFSSDAASKLQQNRPIIQTATDLSKTQTIATSGDGVIRSLLNTSVSPSTTIISTSTQPNITSTPNQTIKSTAFGTLPSTSASQILNQPSLPTATTTLTAVTPVASIPSSNQSPFGSLSPLASTMTTSVQSTSPTTKPIMSTGGFSAFGSRPTIGGPLNLTSPTSSGAAFGSTATTTTTNTGSFFGGGAAATTTTSTPTPFGGGISTTATTTTSNPSAGLFGTATSPLPSAFGSGFGTSASMTTTTSAPSTGMFSNATPSSSSPFGGAFGTSAAPATTSAPSTGSFGSAFGASATVTSPFGSGFGATTSAPTASVFGGFGGFGGASTTSTPSANTGSFGGSGFGSPPTLPATSVGTLTAGTSMFGGGSGSTSSFGSGFLGFGTQSTPSGSSTGFSFGGFGAQPSDATSTQTSFGSFGPPPAATQPPSPFGGGTSFGAASGQSPGFVAPSSPFGASTTQSANSPSFTAYRK